MRRYLPAILAVVLPVALGLGLSGLLVEGTLPNLMFVGTYQVDLAGLASRTGIVISVMSGGVVAVLWWARRRTEQRVRIEEHDTYLETRRRFLRRLDHELKNPVTIIRMGIFNLRHSPNLTEDQNASLERVGQQTERLQKLVFDLRWLTELEERGMEKTPLSLREVIEEAIEARSMEWRGRSIEAHFQEVPWPVGQVAGDRDLLVVAIRNLLDNALKFTERDGLVQIRATDDGHTATIEVADNGIGIPADEIEHVFEELYRGQSAKRISGSGLGLTLVEKIIALHGGTINIRSREGQGTVVTLRLPLAREG